MLAAVASGRSLPPAAGHCMLMLMLCCPHPTDDRHNLISVDNSSIVKLVEESNEYVDKGEAGQRALLTC